MFSTTGNRQRGYSFCQLMIAIGVIIILLGIGSQGLLWVKYRAEETSLSGRGHQFSTALQLYYQAHHTFPDAFPAHLDQDLTPYVDDARLFASLANPDAGAAPLNNSYVTPVSNDANSYVLSLISKLNSDHAVVLFADGTVDFVECLDIQHKPSGETEGTAIKPGTAVTGGTICFTTGTSVELSQNTTAVAVQSFRASDGTPFDILKLDRGHEATMTVVTGGTAIVEVVSDAGITFLRSAKADIEIRQESGHDTMRVSSYGGDIVTASKITDRGIRDYEMAGRVNINPNNNSDFEFNLEKPDGTVITRDDLHANRELEYRGPAVRIRFKPKGNGNQNSLVVNNQPYQLQNGTLYTITATEMSLHLYNDKRGTKGKAMGHWWMDEIQATHARVVEGDGTGVDPDPNGGYTGGSVIIGGAMLTGGRRTLSRGSPVQPGWWVKGEKYQ